MTFSISLLVRLTRSLALFAILLSSMLASAQEQTWKINLKNADINEFVSQVAAITGKTFVVDPRVKGKVTVISNASLDVNGIYELFLSVLRVHGFAAIETGDVVRIQQQTLAKQSGSPLDNAKLIPSEQLVTRVIAAQYVDSAELVKTLRPMIPQYGHIAAVTNPNVVIISDHAENIVRLQALIERIDVPDEEQITVIALKDAWVGTVVELLEKLAPEQLGRNAKGPQRIQIIANERNNSLVLRGKTRPVAEVKKLVAQLDQPATTSGATQVLRLSHGDAKIVSEILRGLVAEGGAADDNSRQKVMIQADESLNAIVARADPAVMAEIVELVRKLDVRRTQVLIEAAIVEIAIDDSLNVGVDFAALDQRNATTPLISTALSPALAAILTALGKADADGTPPVAAVAGLSQPTLAVAKIDLDGFSFGAVLQAISTSSKANLLSTPSILTLDNEEAKILVGQEVPFRTGSFTTTTDGSTNPFTTIQRQDVGITLTVTPHVHDGEAVRLDVSQEVSSVVLSALAATSDSPFSDVVTNKRTIDTTVLANDRQTVVLGGLIQDDIQSTLRKVPLLGDIPVLGKLFQRKEDTRTKRNLLVFLRPTVLRSAEETNESTDRKYSSIWEIEITSGGSKKDAPPPPPPINSLYDGKRD